MGVKTIDTSRNKGSWEGFAPRGGVLLGTGDGGKAVEHLLSVTHGFANRVLYVDDGYLIYNYTILYDTAQVFARYGKLLSLCGAKLV